jgi:phosphate transport system protein
MGALVETSCSLAYQAVFERNLTAPASITTQEAETDRLYHQIETDCIGIMTLQAPVANDMRLLSALLQLVRDLERIGDYALEIGQLATKLFSYNPPPCLPRLRGMFDRVQMMVALCLAAITDLDDGIGDELRQLDQVVNSDYDSLYQTLAQGLEISGSVESNLVLVLMIRNLERMADHAVNVGRRIAAITTG